MKKIADWGAAAPALAVMFSKEVVSSADAVHGLMRMLHTGHGLDRLPPPPPLKTWLLMYRRRRRVEAAAADMLLPAHASRPSGYVLWRTFPVVWTDQRSAELRSRA